MSARCVFSAGPVVLINADFSRRAVVHAAQLAWVPSPIAGIDRRMLDRIGGEVARATSIVRYASNSSFSSHTHDGGEEFLVLDGVFQDEHGDYPKGTYVRNPPTSRHTPGAELGCLLFVKLHQFDPGDRHFVRIDTNSAERSAPPGREGMEIVPLFEDARETVELVYLAPGMSVEIGDPGGFEMLVIDGAPGVDGENFVQQSWSRMPPGDLARLVTGASPVVLWVKRRHLRNSILEAGDWTKHAAAGIPSR